MKSVGLYIKRHLTFKKVQIIKNCRILQNSKWKCLRNQMSLVNSNNKVNSMLRKFVCFFPIWISIFNFVGLFCTHISLYVPDWGQRTLAPEKRRSRQAAEEKKCPEKTCSDGFASRQQQSAWRQFRPQLLSAIRHLEKEKKICHMKRNLDVLMVVLRAPALSFTQCAKLSKIVSFLHFRLG